MREQEKSKGWLCKTNILYNAQHVSASSASPNSRCTSWLPVLCSLSPPLVFATLSAYLTPDDVAVIEDEHVQPLDVHDAPDLVVIQVYITNAYRAYRLADLYRARGS